MCSTDAHKNNIPSEHDDGSSGCGYPLPSGSKTEALVFLSSTIYFIGCWLQAFKNNLKRCHMYIYAMFNFLMKITVEVPKPSISREITNIITCYWRW